MEQIKLYIMNANQGFSEAAIKTIRTAAQKAAKVAVPALNIQHEIDLAITKKISDFIIPEDYLGGRTYTHDFILIVLDEEHIKKDLVYEVICHELCHATRWAKNDEPMESLFDGMILEGLAIAFEEQCTQKQKEKQFFLKTMLKRTDTENEKILKILMNKIDKKYYDYFTIFIAGSEDGKIPRWSGYSVGYYLVKKYLDKTGKTIEQAYTDKYADFRIVLSEN